jgi:hypothetical protein
MGRPQVGLPKLIGDIARYSTKFDMLELWLDVASLPKPQALRRWRKATNPGFSFSVVLPEPVALLGTGAAHDEALARSLECATALEARCIVIATPTEVRPTQQNRDRLGALAAKLPRPGVVLAWEARGLWERDDVLSTARAAGLLPVFDGTREALPPGQLAYTRLRALGAQVPSARAIDKLAEQLATRRDSWVVVEHRPSAQRIRSRLAAVDSAGRNEGPMVVRPSPGRLRAEDEEQ